MSEPANNAYKPRVFISHSAKEPETQALCKAIVSALDADFEVLWDGNLEGSHPWRAAIDEWVWRCDAAVLVLSEAATESRYVAYEATLLRQRWKHSGGQFLLLTAWCPEVTEELLAERMGALQVAEIQNWAKFEAWPEDALADGSAFDAETDKLRRSLEKLKDSYLARSESEKLLFEMLNHQTPSDEALADIANDYALPPMPAGAKRDRAARLARHLLSMEEALGPERFQHLAGGINILKAVLNDAQQNVPAIVNLVAPFCWVPQEGAIALAATPAEPRRAAVWRRSWEVSERMYLYRAYGTRSSQKLKIVEASDRTGGVDELLAHVQSCLAVAICRNPQAPKERIKGKLRELAKAGVPVYLLIPETHLTSETLAMIRGEWADVAIILHGENLTPGESERRFPGVRFIEPPLEPEVEDDARIEYLNCLELAGIGKDKLDSGEAFFP